MSRTGTRAMPFPLAVFAVWLGPLTGGYLVGSWVRGGHRWELGMGVLILWTVSMAHVAWRTR